MGGRRSDQCACGAAWSTSPRVRQGLSHMRTLPLVQNEEMPLAPYLPLKRGEPAPDLIRGRLARLLAGPGGWGSPKRSWQTPGRARSPRARLGVKARLPAELAHRRRADTPVGRLDDLVCAEGEETRRRDGEQERAVGLLQQHAQRAAETQRLARVVAKRTRDEKAEAAERQEPAPRLRFELEPPREAPGEPLRGDRDAGGGDRRAEDADRDATERLCHQPRRPVAHLLVVVGPARPRKRQARGPAGETGVEQRIRSVERPSRNRRGAAAVVVGIEEALRQPPRRKAEEPERDDAEQRRAERLREQLCQSSLGAGGALAAERGEKRESADDHVNEAARDVAEARHDLEAGPPVHSPNLACPRAGNSLQMKNVPGPGRRIPSVCSTIGSRTQFGDEAPALLTGICHVVNM